MNRVVSAPQVSRPVTQLPWIHHPIILSQAKPPETRDFYVPAAIRNRWTKRELERQIQSAAFLRSDRAAQKVSPVVARIHPIALGELKNACRVELSSVVTRRSEQQA